MSFPNKTPVRCNLPAETHKRSSGYYSRVAYYSYSRAIPVKTPPAEILRLCCSSQLIVIFENKRYSY